VANFCCGLMHLKRRKCAAAQEAAYDQHCVHCHPQQPGASPHTRVGGIQFGPTNQFQDQ
jgi:hypothetical protein